LVGGERDTSRFTTGVDDDPTNEKRRISNYLKVVFKT
jgi:hypothetical protein